jgi:hypothetical protein
MTAILYIIFPLVVVLGILINSMTQGKHYAPQAYYRKKRGGASYLYGLASLIARPRKTPDDATRPRPEGSRTRWRDR